MSAPSSGRVDLAAVSPARSGDHRVSGAGRHAFYASSPSDSAKPHRASDRGLNRSRANYRPRYSRALLSGAVEIEIGPSKELSISKMR